MMRRSYETVEALNLPNVIRISLPGQSPCATLARSIWCDFALPHPTDHSNDQIMDQDIQYNAAFDLTLLVATARQSRYRIMVILSALPSITSASDCTSVPSTLSEKKRKNATYIPCYQILATNSSVAQTFRKMAVAKTNR